MTMTADPTAAVAALAAAKDAASLEAAIQSAGFLDAKPGDDRQKLRGGFAWE
jgi:hypothetical protein